MRRSFLLIHVIIFVFVGLYLIQAFQLYRRAGQSEVLVLRTNDILQQVKTIQSGVKDMEVSLQAFILTGAEHYRSSMISKADATIERLSYLGSITLDNPEQREHVRQLTELVAQKKAAGVLVIDQIRDGKIKAGDPALRNLPETGHQEIDERLALMEHAQSQLLASHTSENTFFSRARISFSVASYLLLSALLSVAFYKVRSGITKKAKAEEQAQNRLKMVQDIIDNVPAVLYIKDPDGTYLMVNKKTEAVFRLSAEEIIGKTTEEVHRQTPERFGVYKHTDEIVIGQGKTVDLEELVPTAGRNRYYWVTKFPLRDDNGQIRYIGVVASDITDRKETELRLIESKQEAELARAAQETFLANMSHEIRTPMNGIMGMSNLLMSTPLNEEQKEFNESIQESARNLLTIINDLLDFSKIKSGKFEFEKTAFNLRNTVRQALYPLRFKADEKMVRFHLSIADEVPNVLLGDPLRLQQILINLVGNGIKFTAHGSVGVIIGHEQAGHGINLKVTVKDTGIGIPPDRLDHIFESFAQSKADDARRYGGTGLGLAIVKQLVELQQGVINVTSQPGEGSVFSFTIPYEIAEETSIGRSVIQEEPASHNKLQHIRVLVAEDNLINQKVVNTTLARQGAIVTVANNGEEAIRHISEQPFDVILMDLQMPEVDGYRATRHIRQVLKNNIPIIAMTADALKGEEEKCYEVGMNGYISKPFEPVVLFNLIHSMTEIRHDSHEETSGPKPPGESLLDLSFLHEIAEGDNSYIYEVLKLFVDTMPEGIEGLRRLIEHTDDFEQIARQAHFLKSSTGVVRIRGMYEQLQAIETLATEKKELDQIKEIFKQVAAQYEQAHPLAVGELENYKPSV